VGILRTILALSVVFAHAGWRNGFVFTGGQVAVQCFYVISGFLISYVLNNNRSYSGSPVHFYTNRALRVYPVYLFVVFLSLIAYIVAEPQFFRIFHDAPGSAVALLCFSNLFLFGQDWVMFSGVQGGHLAFAANFHDSEVQLFNGLLVPQAWTLGVELTFYLLAPFIVRDRKRLVLLLLASFSIRAGLLIQGIGFSDPWTYRFFPAELGLFLLGALSQQVITPVWKSLIARVESLPKMGTTLLVVFSVVYFLIPVPAKILLPVYLGVSVLLMPLAFLFQGQHAFDRRIGELSYPIYIGHILAINVMHVVFRVLHIQNDLLRAIINVAASIVFAFVLNELIAKRFESLRKDVRSAANCAPVRVSEVAPMPQPSLSVASLADNTQ
jgi:peptidoglycan/LPS O-acetylase OafA/YrhL